jgi:alkylation response protein AidB-like acyl-CoA dehydrogenase
MDGLELRYSDYALTDDQESVRDAFRDFFTSECPSPRVRAAEPLGHDEKLWGQLTEMGAASMGLPESAGGDGATLVDLTLIAEEAGSALAPVPFIEHAAASRALAATSRALAAASRALAGDPGAPGELLAAAAAGRRILALAMEPADREARQLVPGGAVARDVIALDGRALVAVHADEPPPLVANQGSTPLAWWNLAGGKRTVLAEGPAAEAIYQTARAEWKLLTAAALIGLTQRALEVAVEFAKTRETMGVRIGTLQGVSFPLGDVAIGTSGGRNLIRRAAWTLENDRDHAGVLVPAAFGYAAQVATHGATTSAHMQGGLGFTTEADASLYFLRAKGWSLLAGDPAEDLIAAGDALAARRSQ